MFETASWIVLFYLFGLGMGFWVGYLYPKDEDDK